MPEGIVNAIVLANGEIPERRLLDAAWPGWDAGTDLVIAADGGARHGAALGLRLDQWIGDGDSIERAELDRLVAQGLPMRLVSSDKDESDTELALEAAITAGATSVTILGALGGPRADHALANLALLLHPALGERRATIYDERASRISVLVGPGEGGAPATGTYAGRSGDLVSLLPLSGRAEGVRTEGLRYPLRDEPLEAGPARGLSNVRIEPAARVWLRRGRLLIVETPVMEPPSV
jgi:thiamine pyrophosphokinase